MFAAGMGVGLVFWGCAQPLSLYYTPAPFMHVQPETPQAFLYSVVISYFHWGIHPWCVYAILGLLLAYIQFRKKEKCLMSRALLPVIGRKLTKNWLGGVIDISTVLAVMAGLVTTMGLTTLQVSRGLNYLFGIPVNNIVFLIIIVVITIFYMTSAISGLDKGIKIISNFNLILAIALLGCVILLGPTIEIFNTVTSALGEYISNFVRMSLSIKITDIKLGTWTADWTLFMWATWITWAPLVATFIARVSKGRTIKQFITAVVFVPTLLTVFWFAAFGTMAYKVAPIIGKAAVADPALTLFIVFNQYPLGFVLSLIALLLLITFFVTSADSAIFVLGTLSSHGNLNPKKSRKIIWGILMSGLSFCVIRAGGLDLVKNMAILGAFPFLIFLLASIFSLFRFLYLDRRVVRNKMIKRILYKDKDISDIEKI
jgi:glycine betaine transporter